MSEEPIKEAAYYHARAAEMMVKAQEAPSKATRIAYLNLARKWARQAALLEEQDAQPANSPAAGILVPKPTDNLGKN